MAKTWRILSIDGGGIRGIIPAMALTRLEELIGEPIADMFDVIAGTSIGGILTLGLTCPGVSGRPKYSAKAIEELYRVDGPGIFHNPASWLENVLHAKYKSTSLERLLDQMFGEARLKDALVDVMVPCYDLEHRSPYYFRSRYARRRERYDFMMRDVALATSAAPTVFNPVRIKLPGNLEHISLVDGGVFANNPAMAAYIDTKTVLARPGDDYLIVSLGTGESPKRLVHEDVKRWGYAQWSRPIIELVCDGISASVHAQLRYLLPPAAHQRYYRFQVDLPEESDDSIDNISEANMRGLVSAGTHLVESRASLASMTRLAARLNELKAEERAAAIVPPGLEPQRAPHLTPHVTTGGAVSPEHISICYADADSEEVAHPLADALAARGLTANFNKFAIHPEESIRRVVMESEAENSYGIIVISPSLLANVWAETQISWLFARLIGGHQLLLAVTHGFGDKTATQITAELGWQRAAGSYLDRIIELSQGCTDDGVGRAADALASEVSHWTNY